LPSVVAVGALHAQTTAAADPNTLLRRPASIPFASRPAGVPESYILTHNGFFHPSCVVAVEPDEIVGADRVIRGRDGAERLRLEPCLYAQYDRKGTVVPRAHTFDGWIVWYDFNGNIPATSSIKLSTDWVVPLAPTKVVNQDIAFFNSIETSSGGVDILQPVLDFGEIRNRWSMISEHCCLSGNDVQTTPVPVNAGDVVRGTVEGTSCNVSGVCASWVITTIDVTTGQSTVLNTTAPDGVPIEINPGVLETYDITSCDMLPANGEVTFYDHSLIDASGREVPIRYSFRKFDTAPAEFPMNCGYRGSAVGNRYTLIFGNLPTEIDAGAMRPNAGDASGIVDIAVAPDARRDPRGSDAAAVAEPDGAPTRAGSSGAPTGGIGGSAGGVGGGSNLGTAGTATVGSAFAGAGGGGTELGVSAGAASSGGCSCRSVGFSSGAGGAIGGWVLAAIGLARGWRKRELRSRAL